MDKRKFFEKIQTNKLRNHISKCKGNTSLPQLTTEELQSIYYYTTNHEIYSYLNINDILAKKAALGLLQFLIEAIDSGLNKIPSYKEVCYRGEVKNGRLHNQAKKITENQDTNTPSDIIIIEPSFFISSSSITTVDFYTKSPVKLIITPKENAHDISNFSANPEESEILYKRNTKLIIAKIKFPSETEIEIYLIEA